MGVFKEALGYRNLAMRRQWSKQKPVKVKKEVKKLRTLFERKRPKFYQVVGGTS